MFKKSLFFIAAFIGYFNNAWTVTNPIEEILKDAPRFVYRPHGGIKSRPNTILIKLNKKISSLEEQILSLEKGIEEANKKLDESIETLPATSTDKIIELYKNSSSLYKNLVKTQEEKILFFSEKAKGSVALAPIKTKRDFIQYFIIPSIQVLDKKMSERVLKPNTAAGTPLDNEEFFKALFPILDVTKDFFKRTNRVPEDSVFFEEKEDNTSIKNFRETFNTILQKSYYLLPVTVIELMIRKLESLYIYVCIAPENSEKMTVFKQEKGLSQLIWGMYISNNYSDDPSEIFITVPNVFQGILSFFHEYGHLIANENIAESDNREGINDKLELFSTFVEGIGLLCLLKSDMYPRDLLLATLKSYFWIIYKYLNFLCTNYNIYKGTAEGFEEKDLDDDFNIEAYYKALQWEIPEPCLKEADPALLKKELEILIENPAAVEAETFFYGVARIFALYESFEYETKMEEINPEKHPTATYDELEKKRLKIFDNSFSRLVYLGDNPEFWLTFLNPDFIKLLFERLVSRIESYKVPITEVVSITPVFPKEANTALSGDLVEPVK